MDEAHTTKCSIHLGADKMYHDLRDMYWCPELGPIKDPRARSFDDYKWVFDLEIDQLADDKEVESEINSTHNHVVNKHAHLIMHYSLDALPNAIAHYLCDANVANNDIDAIHQSHIFNDLTDKKAVEVPFVANDVSYKWRYYLVDGTWVTLVKSISHPNDGDHKRIRYNRMHEARMKDVE
uniref:Reverse transcriptase domain-containing protein n=1 Tax=Tanacetum cinerariifolium TaxID=118510 RepID=A0A6L2NPH7_TANCI|nr:hypothetical protein [Tanacetum cinerariifolium]